MPRRAIRLRLAEIKPRESPMSRHHANLIRSIFHDPPSGNMHWREVESLLKHVGASLEPLSGARIRVKLNRMEDVLHRPHHSNVLDTKSLLHIRGFLARAGVTPSVYEDKGAAPS
jgi:HicA toxin of bacterial toxin-antitoxin,